MLLVTPPMWLRLLSQPSVVLYSISTNVYEIISIVLKTAGQCEMVHGYCVKVLIYTQQHVSV